MRIPHCLVAVVFLISCQLCAAEDGLIISVAPKSDGTLFEYKGKHKDVAGLIDAIRKNVVDERTLDHGSVIVLAHRNATLHQLNNLTGALRKFGFLNILFFAVDGQKERMQEIHFAVDPIPYSQDVATILKKRGNK